MGKIKIVAEAKINDDEVLSAEGTIGGHSGISDVLGIILDNAVIQITEALEEAFEKENITEDVPVLIYIESKYTGARWILDTSDIKEYEEEAKELTEDENQD